MFRKGLKTHHIGTRIIRLERTGSTNDIAWRLALEGAPEGTVIIAREQTKGRGRFGRKWFTLKDKSLILSVILRPKLRYDELPWIAAIGAIAVVDAIKDVTGTQAQIQFPNDILMGRKKVAGVLVESRMISGLPDIFILGIGVNLLIRKGEFPKEIAKSASSVVIESGETVCMDRFLKALLEALDHGYAMLCERTFLTLLRKWRKFSYIVHKRVKVQENNRTFIGVVEELHPVEGLLLRLENGHLRVFRGEHIERLEVIGP
jgi:BirA family biotin operon repressor/biotin-[acetyl-CoA-carboxylase] ligase